MFDPLAVVAVARGQRLGQRGLTRQRRVAFSPQFRVGALKFGDRVVCASRSLAVTTLRSMQKRDRHASGPGQSRGHVSPWLARTVTCRLPAGSDAKPSRASIQTSGGPAPDRAVTAELHPRPDGWGLIVGHRRAPNGRFCLAPGAKGRQRGPCVTPALPPAPSVATRRLRRGFAATGRGRRRRPAGAALPCARAPRPEPASRAAGSSKGRCPLRSACTS